jgi:hypothetical protein
MTVVSAMYDVDAAEDGDDDDSNDSAFCLFTCLLNSPKVSYKITRT